MPSHEYLAALEAEARRTLSPAEAAAFVAEAHDHFAASVQARLELGMSLDEAEREAIATFGQTREIAQEIRTREPRIDVRFLLSAVATVAFWALVADGRSFPDWTLLPMLATVVGVHGAYLTFSAKARRVQWRAILLVFLPCLVYRAIPSAQAYVTIEDLWGDKSRWLRAELPENIAENRRNAQKELDQIANLERAYPRFLRGEIDTSPSRIPRYHADRSPRLYARATRDEATTRWSQALANARGLGQVVHRESGPWSKILAAAATRPWPREIPDALLETFKSEGWGPLSFYGALHFAGWAAGRHVRRRSRGEKALA